MWEAALRTGRIQEGRGGTRPGRIQEGRGGPRAGQEGRGGTRPELSLKQDWCVLVAGKAGARRSVTSLYFGFCLEISITIQYSFSGI